MLSVSDWFLLVMILLFIIMLGSVMYIILLYPLTIEYKTCEELLTSIQNDLLTRHSVTVWIAQECWK